MNTVKIHVNKQLDGITFGLPVASLQAIEQEYPYAHPTSSLFVYFDPTLDFDVYSGRFKTYVPSILTGLKEDDLARLQVMFLDPVTGKQFFAVTA